MKKTTNLSSHSKSQMKSKRENKQEQEEAYNDDGYENDEFDIEDHNNISGKK